MPAVWEGSMNSAFSTLETVRWRRYVGDPNPHLVELITYLITYLKDKSYIMSSTLTLSKVRYKVRYKVYRP